jgi:hypothetical protein
MVSYPFHVFVRQGREAITEDDIYAAMENKTVEAMVGATWRGASVSTWLHGFVRHQVASHLVLIPSYPPPPRGDRIPPPRAPARLTLHPPPPPPPPAHRLLQVENTSAGGGGGLVADDPTPEDPDPIPPQLRKSISVYEAGKALVAYITPEYEEIARVRGRVCGGV